MSSPQQTLVDQTLKHAIDLIRQERWQESLAAHYRLLDLSPNMPLGYYGLGVTHYKLGENQSARLNFERCISLDPAYANAHYYLGEIYLRENKPDAARSYFLNALRLNNGHGPAARRLQMLDTPRPAVHAPAPQAPQVEFRPPPQAPAPVRSQPVPTPRVEQQSPQSSNGEFGIFEVLNNDSSPISKEAITLINLLRMKRRPRMSAYLGRLIGLVLLFTLLAVPASVFFSLALVNPRAPEPEIIVVGVIVGAIVGALFCLVIAPIPIKSRSYAFEEGRLIVSKGIFFKQVHNIELYRVVDLELYQTFLNRLTRDGSLILFVEGFQGQHSPTRVQIRGIAKKKELEAIFKQLRNLVMLLRSHPYIKGIIR